MYISEEGATLASLQLCSNEPSQAGGGTGVQPD